MEQLTSNETRVDVDKFMRFYPLWSPDNQMGHKKGKYRTKGICEFYKAMENYWG